MQSSVFESQTILASGDTANGGTAGAISVRSAAVAMNGETKLTLQATVIALWGPSPAVTLTTFVSEDGVEFTAVGTPLSLTAVGTQTDTTAVVGSYVRFAADFDAGGSAPAGVTLSVVALLMEV